MRALIQRVSAASVTIRTVKKCEIAAGLVDLIGFEQCDGQEDVKWLAKKLPDLRIFSDDNGLMNLSVKDINGSILVVSQFTLYASTKKGNRPSFIKAASPEKAIPLYNNFIDAISGECKEVCCGEFGADMKVALVNDGPVTIFMDTRDKE